MFHAPSSASASGIPIANRLKFVVRFMFMCRVLDLAAAKVEIVRTFWLQTKGEPALSPYCLVLGAGVSDPDIPVASKLVPQFRKEIAQARLEQPPDTLSTVDGYYECFETAFPNPQTRRNFLRDLIEGKPPSPANLQAARLLGPEGLTSLAITTNFDLMLPRALQQLRHDHVSLDHPATIIGRYDSRGQTTQVLQIHGTYEHYDFCNVREEILGRATELTFILYAHFLQRCPIVVGYSGWEDDAIMKALKRRLTEAPGSMTAGLYWMCYTKADADALPDWLKNDPSVRVVVASLNGEPSKLPAVEVFGALLAGLEEARAAAAPGPVPMPVSFMALAAAEQALAQGEHERAVEVLQSLDLMGLTAGERSHGATVLRQVYEGTWQTKPETALAACRLWQAVAELPGAITPAEQSLMRARAVYGQGVSLINLDRREEAMALLRKVRKLWISTGEGHVLAERAAHAANALAVALFREGRREEAFAQWHELLSGHAEEKESAEARTYALFNLGHASELAGRADDARVFMSALLDRFEVYFARVNKREEEAPLHDGLGPFITAAEIGRLLAALNEEQMASGDPGFNSAQQLKLRVWDLETGELALTEGTKCEALAAQREDKVRRIALVLGGGRSAAARRELALFSRLAAYVRDAEASEPVTFEQYLQATMAASSIHFMGHGTQKASAGQSFDFAQQLELDLANFDKRETPAAQRVDGLVVPFDRLGVDNGTAAASPDRDGAALDERIDIEGLRAALASLRADAAEARWYDAILASVLNACVTVRFAAAARSGAKAGDKVGSGTNFSQVDRLLRWELLRTAYAKTVKEIHDRGITLLRTDLDQPRILHADRHSLLPFSTFRATAPRESSGSPASFLDGHEFPRKRRRDRSPAPAVPQGNTVQTIRAA